MTSNSDWHGLQVSSLEDALRIHRALVGIISLKQLKLKMFMSGQEGDKFFVIFEVIGGIRLNEVLDQAEILNGSPIPVIDETFSVKR